MKNHSDFGRLIRTHRRQRFLLSGDVERMLCLRRKTISEIERGRVPLLSNDQMTMLAQVLQIPRQTLEDARNRAFPGYDFAKTALYKKRKYRR